MKLFVATVASLLVFCAPALADNMRTVRGASFGYRGGMRVQDRTYSNVYGVRSGYNTFGIRRNSFSNRVSLVRVRRSRTAVDYMPMSGDQVRDYERASMYGDYSYSPAGSHRF